MNSSINGTDFLPARYYAYIVPVLICGLIIAVIGNLYLLLCIRWIRTQAMTANLRLILSLAGADLWAAALLLTGLLVNNVVPHLIGVWFGRWTTCFFLVFELLRVAGLITSALHLLALALNHCFSIMSPLKYQTTVTPSFSYVCIGFLWTLPVVTNFLLASSNAGDGFRTSACEIGFYFRFRFRLGIFVQFVIPLFIMLLIYSFILIRLSAARRRFLKLSPRSSQTAIGTIKLMIAPRRENRSSNQSIENCISGHGKEGILKRALFEYNKEHSRSVESRTSIFSFDRLISVKRKTKAITTTLFILGTFVTGWMPAVCVFLLVCNDCHFTQANLTQLNLLAVNTMANAMIVTKLIVNPFIYAYRLVEIRYALWVMHDTRLGQRPVDINRLPMKFRRMAPSVSANIRPLNESPRPLRLLISAFGSKKPNERETNRQEMTPCRKPCTGRAGTLAEQRRHSWNQPAGIP